eukprot:6191342-Pleurochrysis_carterae.AAC.1
MVTYFANAWSTQFLIGLYCYTHKSDKPVRTGCSSLWDEFRTSPTLLARVLCFHKCLRAFESVQNDLGGHNMLISGGTDLGILARIWLYTTLAAHFAGCPCFASK